MTFCIRDRNVNYDSISFFLSLKHDSPFQLRDSLHTFGNIGENKLSEYGKKLMSNEWYCICILCPLVIPLPQTLTFLNILLPPLFPLFLSQFCSMFTTVDSEGQEKGTHFRPQGLKAGVCSECLKPLVSQLGCRWLFIGFVSSSFKIKLSRDQSMAIAMKQNAKTRRKKY